MSKNLSFENSMKEDKSEEFMAFIKDYNTYINKEENYKYDKEIIIFSFLCLLGCEIGMYYLVKESVSKNMVLFGMVFMYVSCFGKTILGLLNSFLNRKQRKKDMRYIQQKAQDWIEFLKDKENKLNIARSLITRLENVEKIRLNIFNKENMDKSIKLQEEDIYNFIQYEVKESDFQEMENIIIKINNIENDTLDLLKKEQDLQQVKNEINAGMTSSLSNSFKGNKKTTSFN